MANFSSMTIMTSDLGRNLAQVISEPIGMIFGEATYRVYLVLSERTKWRNYADKFLVGTLALALPALMFSRRFQATLGMSTAWLLIRMCGTTNRRLKGDDELTSKNDILCCLDDSKLGEGLAFSYRQGLMRHLFYKSGKFAYLEAIEQYETAEEVTFENPHFFILLPKSCSIPDNFTGTRIEKLKKELEVRIAPELSLVMNRKSLKMSIFKVWSSDFKKDCILIFEMPHVLKSVIKAKGDLKDKDYAEKVGESNILKFRSVLKRLLEKHAEASNSAILPYHFIMFDDRDWSTQEYENKLADVILEHVARRNASSFLDSDEED